jgi:hypothetical protein
MAREPLLQQLTIANAERGQDGVRVPGRTIQFYIEAYLVRVLRDRGPAQD